jgi:(p)ppGpp synthase/HD superfamily hydrolase
MDLSLIEKAAAIAAEGHKEQTRKHGHPYIVHPFMVAMKLKSYDFSDVVVAAGLVHDVLEDTTIGEDRLLSELGAEVLEIVRGLTEDKTLPWKERKLGYIELVRSSSFETKAVSVSDKVHNISNMHYAYSELGPAIWEKFGNGGDNRMWFDDSMIAMLDEESWEHPLLAEYKELVQSFKELL